jgi:hypothetical protein
MPSKPLDITGHKYGDLTCLSFSHRNPKNKMAHWKCRCDCGSVGIYALGNIRSGHTTSCGCKKLTGVSHLNYKHGMSHTGSKVYKSWTKIRERCKNPNCVDYPTYGGAGITVADEFEDFLRFYAEVGDPPNDGGKYSIDRLNPNLGYCPGNIRWADSFQQARNKRKPKNNTSGVTGVVWEKKVGTSKSGGITYARVQWREFDAAHMAIRFRTKCFSVNTYGLLESFALAVKFRLEKIQELNQQGYGYSEYHGTQKGR